MYAVVFILACFVYRLDRWSAGIIRRQDDGRVISQAVVVDHAHDDDVTC